MASPPKFAHCALSPPWTRRYVAVQMRAQPAPSGRPLQPLRDSELTTFGQACRSLTSQGEWRSNTREGTLDSAHHCLRSSQDPFPCPFQWQGLRVQKAQSCQENFFGSIQQNTQRAGWVPASQIPNALFPSSSRGRLHSSTDRAWGEGGGPHHRGGHCPPTVHNMYFVKYIFPRNWTSSDLS